LARIFFSQITQPRQHVGFEKITLHFAGAGLFGGIACVSELLLLRAQVSQIMKLQADVVGQFLEVAADLQGGEAIPLLHVERRLPHQQAGDFLPLNLACVTEDRFVGSNVLSAGNEEQIGELQPGGVGKPFCVHRVGHALKVFRNLLAEPLGERRLE
jgi:hypothetical protein